MKRCLTYFVKLKKSKLQNNIYNTIYIKNTNNKEIYVNIASKLKRAELCLHCHTRTVPGTQKAMNKFLLDVHKYMQLHKKGTEKLQTKLLSGEGGPLPWEKREWYMWDKLVKGDALVRCVLTKLQIVSILYKEMMFMCQLGSKNQTD